MKSRMRSERPTRNHRDEADQRLLVPSRLKARAGFDRGIDGVPFGDARPRTSRTTASNGNARPIKGLPDLIFLAGLPGSGKTFFGNFLQDRHPGSVRHVNAEAPGAMEAAGLSQLLELLLGPPGARYNRTVGRLFLDALRKIAPHVIVTWGYPPLWLPFPFALRQSGVDLVWFDGDPIATEHAYRRRTLTRVGDNVAEFHARMSAFHATMAWIDLIVRPQLNGLFRVISTISAGPRYLPAEEIYDRMFRR